MSSPPKENENAILLLLLPLDLKRAVSREGLKELKVTGPLLGCSEVGLRSFSESLFT